MVCLHKDNCTENIASLQECKPVSPGQISCNKSSTELRLTWFSLLSLLAQIKSALATSCSIIYFGSFNCKSGTGSDIHGLTHEIGHEQNQSSSGHQGHSCLLSLLMVWCLSISGTAVLLLHFEASQYSCSCFYVSADLQPHNVLAESIS